MRWIVEAIKAVGGKVEDRDALLAALRKVDIKDTPRGPITVDAVGQPGPEHLRAQGRAVGGKPAEHRDRHLPGVGQFWKYKPEEY